MPGSFRLTCTLVEPAGRAYRSEFNLNRSRERVGWNLPQPFKMNVYEYLERPSRLYNRAVSRSRPACGSDCQCARSFFWQPFFSRQPYPPEPARKPSTSTPPAFPSRPLIPPGAFISATMPAGPSQSSTIPRGQPCSRNRLDQTGLSQAHGACLVPISSSRSGTHAIAGPGAAGHREELPAFQRWQADRAGRHPAARSCAQCHRRDPRLYPSRSLRFQCKRDHSRASSLAGSNCRRYEKQRARGQSLRRRP